MKPETQLALTLAPAGLDTGQARAVLDALRGLLAAEIDADPHEWHANRRRARELLAELDQEPDA